MGRCRRRRKRSRLWRLLKRKMQLWSRRRRRRRKRSRLSSPLQRRMHLWLRTCRRRKKKRISPRLRRQRPKRFPRKKQKKAPDAALAGDDAEVQAAPKEVTETEELKVFVGGLPFSIE